MAAAPAVEDFAVRIDRPYFVVSSIACAALTLWSTASPTLAVAARNCPSTAG
jgi:hypothetical protein